MTCEFCAFRSRRELNRRTTPGAELVIGSAWCGLLNVPVTEKTCTQEDWLEKAREEAGLS